jgi:hypothetical protein
VSGDAAAVWGTLEPSRTVLCVAEGPELTLAAAPTAADREAVSADLSSREIWQGSEAFGAVHRDHAYRASWSLGGIDAPWMKNEYTAGFPEWLPHLAFRATGSVAAGRLTTMALGGLVLALVVLCASRIGGWPAGAIAGSLLAVDPAFHMWKRILAGPEVWLQLCGMVALWCVLRAIQESEPRRLVPAAIAVGIGLHVKPTFAAAAVPLALLSLPLVPWSRYSRRGWSRLTAVLVVCVLLGASPSLAFWATRPAASQGHQESATGRTDALFKRWNAPKRAEPDSDMPRKEVGLARTLLAPASWMSDYWSIRAARDNDPRTVARPERDRPPLIEDSGMRAALILAGLAVFGALRRRGVWAWAVGLGVVVPICVRLLHPDPHHLGVALPFVCLAIGVGAAALPDRRSGWAVLAFLVAAALLGRGAGLARLDGSLEERTGRILDQRAWQVLGDALLEEGALSPAALDYEVMGLAELYTAGQVRPFLYARASDPRNRDCLKAGSDAWLAQVLRAHAGGHLLASWGTEGIPTLAGRTSWVEPDRLRRIAASQGQGIRAVREVVDARGRWTATLYAVSPQP